ncbi:hypothetical protein D3C81_1848930 [compost metagenome]
MLQSDALVCLPERLQVLAVAVFNPIIEQIHHLPDVSEVSGESGLLNSLITCTGLPEPKGWTVMLLDGLDESFDLDGDVGLGKVGIGIAFGHGGVPDDCLHIRYGMCAFLTDDLWLA